MPYRDDEEALHRRRIEIDEDLRRVRAETARLGALAQDEARLSRELLDVERRLEQRRRRLPVLLSQLTIASPCHADWNAMRGDERARFCGICEKNVYNLSAMSADEAERLLREREGDVCVRFYQRADGTVMTADCPIGARKRRVRRAVAAAAVSASAGVLGFHVLAPRMGGVEGGARMGKIEAAPLVEERIELRSPVMGQAAVREVEEEVEPAKPAPSPPAKSAFAPRRTAKAPAR